MNTRCAFFPAVLTPTVTWTHDLAPLVSNGFVVDGDTHVRTFNQEHLGKLSSTLAARAMGTSGQEDHMRYILHTWEDGQILGFAKYGPSHWQHFHNDHGSDVAVGPIYPSKTALMIQSALYQRENWGI